MGVVNCEPWSHCQNVFRRDDRSRSTLAVLLAEVQGGVMAVDCDDDLASNTEQRRSREVPPAWNNLIFSDGFPGVGTDSDSLSINYADNIAHKHVKNKLADK